MDNIRANNPYAHVVSSNLVLASRRERPTDAASTIESLRSHHQIKDLSKSFGARVRPDEKVREKLKKRVSKKKQHLASDYSADGSGGVSVTDRSHQLGTQYIPLATETRRVYQLLLDLLRSIIGDQPNDVYVTLLDDIIHIIRNEGLPPSERQAEVKSIMGHFGSVSDEEYSRLYNETMQLSDYTAPTMGDNSASGGDASDGPQKVTWMTVDSDDESETGSGANSDDEHDNVDDDHVLHIDDPEHEMLLRGDDDALAAAGGAARGAGDKLNILSINSTWLLSKLRQANPTDIVSDDDSDFLALMDHVLQLLASNQHAGSVENELSELFNFSSLDLVNLLITHRFTIVAGTRLSRAADESQRQRLLREMEQDGRYHDIIKVWLQSTKGFNTGLSFTGGASPLQQDQPSDHGRTQSSTARDNRRTDVPMQYERSAHWRENLKVLDLNYLAQMSLQNAQPTQIKLPEHTQFITEQQHQEIIVPAAKPSVSESIDLVEIKDLPHLAQYCFPGVERLNRIQSKIYDTAMKTSDNMLICAPTGAGKTNCAMLAISREIVSALLNQELDKTQIVYIAPMKALVREVVENLRSRFTAFSAAVYSQSQQTVDIRVQEVSGDVNISREQLAKCHILVSTPEKWDVLTRRDSERSIYKNVTLVIIDEIHLLQDTRGPVLESIIARGMRYTEKYTQYIRFIGLSATLANYHDVGLLLRVDPSKGLFYFDSSYRPCPLQMNYIAVNAKKGYKYDMLLNTLCYQKTTMHLQSGSVLVFTHSRRDTVTTAKYIIDQLKSDDQLEKVLSATHIDTSRLLTMSSSIQDIHLKEIIQYGIGIHHGGMSRNDREIVENLFAERALHTLVSTATLAWGVNLPAHTVIIKGTHVYSPEKGDWVLLSTQDVIQMLGRAGRPQYDTFGEGIIITHQNDIQTYIAAISAQIPIESQMMQRLCDAMNAEIVNGTIHNLLDGVDWFQYTYLYIRMLRNPFGYGISHFSAQEDDPQLKNYCTSLIHTAFLQLSKFGLIDYNITTNTLSPKRDGIVASKYYLTYQSVYQYAQQLTPYLNEIEVLRIFAHSKEFSTMGLRQEETLELENLLYTVPIAIKEPVSDIACKANVLLQAYITRLPLNGLALSTDMIYISQSASRIMRALYELLTYRKFCAAAMVALQLAISIDHRIWPAQCPLRQFIIPDLKEHLVATGSTMTPQQIQQRTRDMALLEQISQRIERTDLDWETICDSDDSAITELTGKDRAYDLIHFLPRIQSRGFVQPVSASEIRIKLQIECDFDWSQRNIFIPQNTLRFAVMIHAIDSLKALTIHEFTLSRQNFINETPVDVVLTLPITKPLPFAYYANITSLNYLLCESTCSLSMANLIVPALFKRLTQLSNIRPLSVMKGIPWPMARDYFMKRYHITELSPVHSQVYADIVNVQKNVILAASRDAHTIILSELALFASIDNHVQRLQRKQQDDADDEDDDDDDFGAIFIIYPTVEQATALEQYWKPLLDSLSLSSYTLSGSLDLLEDMKHMISANIIYGSVEYFDAVSRSPHFPKVLSRVHTIICHDLHTLVLPPQDANSNYKIGNNTMYYEPLLIRFRYLLAQHEFTPRFLLFSQPITNALDISQWLKISTAKDQQSGNVYAFHNDVMQYPRDVKLTAITNSQMSTIMQNISTYAPCGAVSLYVNSNDRCWFLAKEIIQLSQLQSTNIQNERRRVYHALLGNQDVDPSEVISVDHPVLSKLHRGEDHEAKDAMEQHADEDDEITFAPPFVHISDEELMTILPRVSQQQCETLVMGIGVLYIGIPHHEREIVLNLYTRGAIQIMIIHCDLVFSLPVTFASNLVVIVDSTKYNNDMQGYKMLDLPHLSAMVSTGDPRTPHNTCILELGGSPSNDNDHDGMADDAVSSNAVAQPPQSQKRRTLITHKSHVIVYASYNDIDTMYKTITRPICVESHLPSSLTDVLMTEIIAKRVGSFQDGLDYFTWSLFYRRILLNPNFYQLLSTSREHIAETLSKIVEEGINLLIENDCVAKVLPDSGMRDSASGAANDEDDDFSLVTFTPLNLGRIQNYYRLTFKSLQLVVHWVKPSLKHEDLLLGLPYTYDVYRFVNIPPHYQPHLMTLGRTFPLFAANNAGDELFLKNSSGVYCLILLQCYLHRLSLIDEINEQLRTVLQSALSMLQSIVDIVSSLKWGLTAITAIELMQFLTMGVVPTNLIQDNPHTVPPHVLSTIQPDDRREFTRTAVPQLLQIPYFNADVIATCFKHDIKTVNDLIECEDDVRGVILKPFTREQSNAIAMFCNNYPSVDVQYKLASSSLVVDQQSKLHIVIDRSPEDDEDDEDEDPADSNAIDPSTYTISKACALPFPKKEGWFCILMDEQKSIYGIKRSKIDYNKRLIPITIDFIPPSAGTHQLKLLVMSDSYIGCDQEFTITIDVASNDTSAD